MKMSSRSLGAGRWLAGAAAIAVVGAVTVLIPAPANADMAAAEKWVDQEFQPSTLSRDDQLKEMEWFIKAA